MSGRRTEYLKEVANSLANETLNLTEDYRDGVDYMLTYISRLVKISSYVVYMVHDVLLDEWIDKYKDQPYTAFVDYVCNNLDEYDIFDLLSLLIYWVKKFLDKDLTSDLRSSNLNDAKKLAKSIIELTNKKNEEV